MQETPGSIPGSGRPPGEGKGNPLQYSWASLVAQLVKKSACNVGDLGSIPGLGRSPGGRNGNPLQYSCLGNPMDRGAWWAVVCGGCRVGHDLATKQQQQPAFKSDDAEAAPSDCAPRMSTWKPCRLQTLPLPLLQHERAG